KMKKGSLWSKEWSFEAFLPRVPRIGVETHSYAWIVTPQPLIKSRHGQQLCLSMLRCGNPRICVDRYSSTPEASIARA
ncbi:hypothetical protein PIB30_100922, partial [Stylosanthes scabra]|nr:hypothetical protein [Stylosanthes scabra]